MRYHDMNHHKNLFRCDRCGRDGLPSIINSGYLDYCLDCWTEVITGETEHTKAENSFPPHSKRGDSNNIHLHP